jgi:hypothetical protein
MENTLTPYRLHELDQVHVNKFVYARNELIGDISAPALDKRVTLGSRALLVRGSIGVVVLVYRR